MTREPEVRLPAEHEMPAPDNEQTAPARRRRSVSARQASTDLALIAAFAALIAACSLLPALYLGGGLVPITFQTFGVLLAGAVLGARRGFLAVLLYLAVGAAGFPVFAGGSAGLAPFAGPTAGYLISFPLAAAITGFLVQRLPRRRLATSVPLILLAGLAGSFTVTHPLGILGLMWRADLSAQAALLTDLVFWPGDVVKNLLMALVATAVHRAFPDLLPSRR
ncbi:biotin transporter BioY [Bogoriella caseilytica]|nr:biotin transporter BioY [Bogoriella caseilytica]